MGGCETHGEKQLKTVKNSEENFEERVSRQALRPVPKEWRGEVLAAARAARPTVAAVPWMVKVQRQLVGLLWPHPKAWAGLAAVWVCIVMLNFSTRDTAPRGMEKAAAPSPEMVVELKKQQRMFAELVGGYETVEADRPRVFAPRPRSGRVEAGVI